MTFGQRRKVGVGYSLRFQRLRMGNLQIVEEELKALGRQILVRQLRNNSTQGI